MEGLSLRTILANILMQTIIFLYLLDNDTSWMILISSGVGLAIEIWKVQKTVLVSLDWSSGIKFTDRVAASTRVSITKKYDEIGLFALTEPSGTCPTQCIPV